MNFSFFRKSLSIFSLLFILMISTPGCIYLVVGGIGALGGYVVSPDTVEGLTENGSIEVWDAAVEIVSIMGVVLEEHEDGGLLVARIHGTTVTVSVIPIGAATVKLSVKARKYKLPRIAVAQNVFVKVMSYLKE